MVNQSDNGLASVDDKYDGYLLGAAVPVGAGLIRASYSSVRFGDGAAGVTGSDPRAQKFALGYVHNLSKRTALYATVARVNNRQAYVEKGQPFPDPRDTASGHRAPPDPMAVDRPRQRARPGGQADHAERPA